MNAAKLIKVFRARQKLYQSDPVLFAKEVVGYEADVWQADTLRDLADPDCRRVSVRSGQGVGKRRPRLWPFSGSSPVSPSHELSLLRRLANSSTTCSGRRSPSGKLKVPCSTRSFAGPRPMSL